MTFILLKAGCLAIYALALAGAAGLLPGTIATTMEYAAVARLVAHVMELIVVFGKVRLYRGSLAVSILLTLLFGLLHWKPLADAHAASKV